ncbi:hypothetical protein Bca101_032007 [Brassica carinata]
MSANKRFHLISDLKPFKDAWRVQVKLGAKDQCSCKRTLIKRVQRNLPLGKWRVIQNTKISGTSGKYKPTKLGYKMNITNDTVFTDSDLTDDSSFLSLASYEEILNGSADTKCLIDIIGQAIDIGEVQIIQVHNEDRKRILFRIRDNIHQNQNVEVADTIFMASTLLRCLHASTSSSAVSTGFRSPAIHQLSFSRAHLLSFRSATVNMCVRRSRFPYSENRFSDEMLRSHHPRLPRTERDPRKRDDFLRAFNRLCSPELVHMYTACGSIEDAQKVFDESSSSNVYSWNALLRGTVISGKRRYGDVLSTFTEMREQGVDLNVYSLSNVFKSFAGASALRQGLKTHALAVKNGLFSSEFLKTSVVDMYFKCGKVGLARRVFDVIEEKDIVSWGAMIAGLAHNKRQWEALGLFRMMISQEGIYPNSVIITMFMVSGAVGRMTLGGLLALGYNVVVSYKLASTADMKL